MTDMDIFSTEGCTCIYADLDLSTKNKSQLSGLGYVKSGECWVHPRHWRAGSNPDGSDTTYYYKDSFVALTPEAKAYANSF
jgi:hypothetical protein